jgi:hypothetical protein
MKSVILAVLLAVGQALMPVPGKAAESQTHTSREIKQKANDNQRPSPTASIKLPVSPKPQTATGQAESGQNAEKAVVIRKPVPVTVAEDWWYRAYVILTGLLLVVGIFGIQYARKTLRAIEQQSRAAKVAAEAAKASSDTLKRGERPWILASIDDRAMRENQPDDQPITMIVCNMTNLGRTVALVEGVAVKMDRVEIDQLPAEPDYASPEVWPNAIPIPPNGGIQRSLYLGFVGRSAVERGANFLYIYGRVLYRDAYGDAHETRFCYRFWNKWRSVDPQTAGFHIGGPANYNKAT